MSDHLFKFKEHLKVLNRSPATIEAYTDQARLFMAFLGTTDIRQVTPPMIETFIKGLYDYRSQGGKPYSLNTITLKIRSIKRFFEFLEQSNVIFINPCEFITEPRPEKNRIKTTLTNHEAKQILDQPNLGTLIGIRDRTILEVFYSTGIRLAELCHLTIYDADLTGGMLRINSGKGGKDRVVPMGKHAVTFLREYIAKVRPRFTQKNRTSRTLFINQYGGPVSDQVVTIMIRRCVKASKVKKHVTAHTFRHTFATLLVKNGADITAVQKMMGHREISTTQEYLRTLGIDIKAEHKKTHPRERDKEKPNAAKPNIRHIKGNYERKQH
jgi:integrase/recombinase XerD